MFDKRGEKLISVYWFFILFIVAAGIVYMAALFYGNPYDVRELEASVLSEKVADCISNKIKLSEDFGNINQDNFLEICKLNFGVEDTLGWEDDQYFLSVNFLKFNDNSLEKSFFVGNKNLEEFCENGVVCIDRNLYTLISGEPYLVKIKSIVRKTEKNVR